MASETPKQPIATPVVKSAVSGYPTSAPPTDPVARQNYDKAMRQVSRNDLTKQAMLGFNYEIITRLMQEL